MHTAYHSEFTEQDKNITLSPEESNHAVKVLRMLEGTKLQVANGKGIIADASIKLAHHKRCELEIHNYSQKEASKPLIHIAIAPTKSMDRMTWFVEKATEIGVDKISLIKCANNERGIIKTEKLFKTALSAMKQSKRFFLPEIEDLTSFKDFVSNNKNGGLAHCNTELDNQKTSLLNTPIEGPILIGPEGDFRKEEIELALKFGYKTIDLGENILRTETAALYAVTILSLNRK